MDLDMIVDVANPKEEFDLDELIKLTPVRKDKVKEVQKTVEIIAGQRRSVRHNENREIKKELEESNLTDIEYAKTAKHIKETIKEIEHKAREIAKTIDLTVSEEDVKNNSEKYKKFLFTTDIHALSSMGIDTDGYINEYDILKYNSKNGDLNTIISIPTQLVLIYKLNKIFDYQFLQKTDASIRFNDLDRMISLFISENHTETFKTSYSIFENMIKKLLVETFSTVEGAFRSDKIWINSDFKKFITSDVIMLKCLSGKLSHSFSKFVTELCKTKDGKIFSNIQRLDYVIHEASDFDLVEILAGSIKCMTPCFALDYFHCVKTLYLFCSLLNVYLDRVEKKKIEFSRTDLSIIAKVCSLMYQNTRMYQNTSLRTLPSFENDIDPYTQMYYLNHTIIGPQFYLLKLLEKSIVAIA